MVLATDGRGALGFFEAKKVFYLDRRDTRERLVTGAPIWTFVIEASPAARVVLTQIFGMRILEDSLDWAPKPGDSAPDEESLGKFRGGLRRLAPYFLARVGADRADERLARQDACSLRDFIDHKESPAHGHRVSRGRTLRSHSPTYRKQRREWVIIRDETDVVNTSIADCGAVCRTQPRTGWHHLLSRKV